jgi:hypothetical protein
MRTAAPAALALVLAFAARATAQDADSPASEHPPAVSFGTSAGALKLPNGRTEQGVSAILQFQPRDWLTLSVTPTWAHAKGSASNALAVSGLTDVSVDAGLSHTFDAPLSPSVGLSLDATLPTGDTLKGLGSGTTSFGAGLDASLEPVSGLTLSGGIAVPLSTDNLGSILSADNGGSVSLEAGYALGGGVNASAGISSDLARGDSAAEPARSVAGGLSLGLVGPLTLAVDGSRRISGDAPTWSLTVGIGTAFAGVNPVGPTSPLRRLKHVFAHSGNGRGNGRRKNG